MTNNAEHRSNTVRRFFRMHNRSLTFVGAFIIFATFVFKDGLRDELKDKVDGMASAENIFLVRYDTSNIWLEVSKLDVLVNLQGAPAYTPEALVGLHLDLETRQESFVEELIDTSSKLNETLPAADSVRTTIDPLADDVRAIKQTIDHLHQSIRPPLGAQLDEDNRKLNDVQTAMTTYTSRAAALLDKTMHAARSARERYETRLKLITAVSFGLYALGWAFALIGRLYGLKSLDE